MKYFTRGWAHGEFTEDAANAIRESYWQRVEAIAPQLTAEASQLANDLVLHDALLAQVRWNAAAQDLALVLICGSSDDGYREIRLTYSGAELGDRPIAVLRERARDRMTELAYDEVDVDPDGTFVHRLLFEPEGELSIWFKDVAIDIADLADRRVELPDFFVEEAPPPDEGADDQPSQ
jgi:hypothetical protein